MDSWGVYLSRISPEFFLKPVYPTMLPEKFQIHGVKITGKYICESKIESVPFFLMSSSKILPQVFIITTPDRMKLLIFPEQRFLKIYFSPAERGGEDFMELKKMIKIKLARVLVTSFGKFHHFSQLYIFGFCFVMA